MRYKEHCKECQEKLGKDWSIVHRWLDEFAGQDLGNHRVFRHHKEGIEEVRKMWGDEAMEAAKLHVVADMAYIPTKDEMDRSFVIHGTSVKGD